jgi:hypothetical protein
VGFAKKPTELAGPGFVKASGLNQSFWKKTSRFQLGFDFTLAIGFEYTITS